MHYVMSSILLQIYSGCERAIYNNSIVQVEFSLTIIFCAVC
jgi:hypothetical protein